MKTFRDLARECERNVADVQEHFELLIRVAHGDAAIMGVLAAFTEWPSALIWVVLGLSELAMGLVFRHGCNRYIQEQLRIRQEAMDAEKRCAR